jgi:hypothetical protein
MNDKNLIKAPMQEPVDKKGSPCPEFWDWLSKAYNFEGIGNFTKYNMEVAFLAGMQATSPPSLSPPAAQPAPVQEPVAWRYTRIGHSINPQFMEAGKIADELRVGVTLDGGSYALRPSKEHMDWTPLYTTPPVVQRQWVGLTEWEIVGMKAAIKGTLVAQMP